MYYEVFWSSGGHGGPFSKLSDARKYAKRYIAGSRSTTSAVIKRSTKKGYVTVERVKG